MRMSPSRICLVALLVCLALIPAVFVFGNPQWNRWIYVCRVYYLPRFVPEDILSLLPWSPEGYALFQGKGKRDYSGAHRHWDHDGTLRIVHTYKDGVLHGPYRFFREDGKEEISGTYSYGRAWDGLFYEVQELPDGSLRSGKVKYEAGKAILFYRHEGAEPIDLVQNTTLRTNTE